jgi:hypothetical protein
MKKFLVAISMLFVFAGVSKAVEQPDYTSVVITSYTLTKVANGTYGNRSVKIGNPLAASTTIYIGASTVVSDVVWTSTFTNFTKTYPDAFVTWTTTYTYTTLKLPTVGEWFNSITGAVLTYHTPIWAQLAAGVSSMTVRVIDDRK